jgi:type II secretory pathway pseudopilin PulG
MRRALGKRLSALDGEAGLTLIEMLVAAAMSVVLVGAASSMLISAVRDQPQLSKRAQNITTARYQLERVTREIRNGIKIDVHSPSEVSFVARVRKTTCGGSPPAGTVASTIKCEVTYKCAATSCTRIEANEGVYTGAEPTTILTGIDSAAVFCFVPSANQDPTICGPAGATAPTYIGVTLRVPNPTGSGHMTISDGASLRAATLSY